MRKQRNLFVAHTHTHTSQLPRRNGVMIMCMYDGEPMCPESAMGVRHHDGGGIIISISDGVFHSALGQLCQLRCTHRLSSRE